MSTLKWTAALAVGDDEIDQQHQHLLRRVNALLAAIDRGVDPKDLKTMVDFLEDYAVLHFSLEEFRMREAKYDDLAQHRTHHEAFIGDLLDFKDRLARASGNAALADELAEHLVNWVKRHVMGSDREMGAFLAKHNAAKKPGKRSAKAPARKRALRRRTR